MSSDEQLFTFDTPIQNNKVHQKIEKRQGTLESFLGMGSLNDVLAGVTVNEKTALAYSVVYACIDAIAGDLSSISLNVYRRLSNGGKQKDWDHPMWRILHDSPNEEQTADEFRYALISNTLRWGNGYAEIERANGGMPLALHLIPPQSVEPKRDRNGKLYFKISSGRGGNIPAVDMIHLKCLGSPEGDVGYSPIKQAREAIGLGIAAEQFGAAYFGNSARPGGVISFENTLDEAAIKNLRESIQAIHGGPANFGKWMIVEEGGTITPYSIPPNDSQFLETRIHQVQEICRFYRVPSSIVNENSKNTFSNSIEEGQRYVTHCLRVWAVRIEKHLNKKLFPDGEYYCEHLLDSLMRGDPTARTAALKEQFLNGALTLNEWREIENRNPVEDPTQHFMQAQMKTLAQILAGPKEDPPQEPEPIQEPQEPTEEPQEKEDKSVMEEIESRTQATEEALKGCLVDCLGRMARREIKAVKNAAKHPKQFLRKIDEFYDSHKPFMAEAILPSVRAWLAFCEPEAEPDKRAEDLAERLTEGARGALIELSGEVTADGLVEAVDKWVEERNTNFVTEITGE